MHGKIKPLDFKCKTQIFEFFRYKGEIMTELVMIKSENKNLRKQLKGDNKKLFSNIAYYVSRHVISNQNYQLLINEVLVYFVDRTNLGENLWNKIENPKEYSDNLINKYEGEIKTWKRIISEYSILFISLICIYFIIRNIFSPSSVEQSNPWLIEVKTEGLASCLAYSLFGLYYEFMMRSNLFNSNDAFRYQNILLFVSWGFSSFVLIGVSSQYIFSFILPKIILYIGLTICVCIIYLIKKTRVF